MLATIPLLLTMGASASSIATPTPRSGDGAPPMRLLLVDLDDVGYDLLRATPTPTLDWLETNGRFFTNFTTAAICSPSRAMMNTGVYPTHVDLLLGKNVNATETYSMPLAPLEPLAQVVAGAGFSTAKVGKWHLAPTADSSHVLRAGWQRYRGSLSNLRSGGGTSDYFNYTKWIDGVETSVQGGYATTDETNDAIRNVRQGIEFISVSYHAPHVPVHVPPAHLHSVSPLNTDYDRTRAMLAACDTELARLLRRAIAEDYTVIVFSDNGTSQTIGGLKGTLFEGGIVTPMWAYGPGVAAGRDATRVGMVDIYDTVLDLFGISAKGATRGPQSQSFQRALQGLPQYRRWSYSDRFNDLGVDPRSSSRPWPRTLRSERYKLMRDQTTVGDRLYDLVLDPGEMTNLLDAGPLAPEAQRIYDSLRIVFDGL